jgi:aspartate aminotransferase
VPASATIAARLQAAKPSLTKTMTQKARLLKAQGVDVITLSQGELDFDTPENVRRAGIAAIESGKTRYTEVPGILSLREAIAAKLSRENGLVYAPEAITVGAGAKQILFDGLFAAINPGDEVIVPTPCWVSYPEMVSLVGGVPVEVRTGEADRWTLQPDPLRAALTPRARAILFNSPSNPTGTVYLQEDWRKLIEVLRNRPDIWILADEIYEPLTYDGVRSVSILNVAPDLAERTLLINGVSKSAAMTGWRLGYGAGPQRLIDAMNVLQSQSTSHASSISQYAALEALSGDQSHHVRFRAAMQKRRDLVCGALGQIEGLSLTKPAGAFYVYVNVGQLIGASKPDGTLLETDMDVALYWLEAGVAGVPGVGFLASPYVRLSFALDEASLVSACDRIARACSRLKRASALTA